MRKSKKKEEYYGGRIKNLIETAVLAIKQYPEMLDNTDKLHALLKEKVEGYGKVEACFNCRRSMKVTGYTADLHDALLILAMAREVKKNMLRGMTFTEANMVHLPTLKVSNATLKRQTKCDYLGLVKQSDKWRGSGYWCLTAWAWKALRGEEIPRTANYWEGKLISRSVETTALATMFKTHLEAVQQAIAKRKAVRADYRADFQGYDASQWTEFAGLINEEQ